MNKHYLGEVGKITFDSILYQKYLWRKDQNRLMCIEAIASKSLGRFWTQCTLLALTLTLARTVLLALTCTIHFPPTESRRLSCSEQTTCLLRTCKMLFAFGQVSSVPVTSPLVLQVRHSTILVNCTDCCFVTKLARNINRSAILTRNLTSRGSCHDEAWLKQRRSQVATSSSEPILCQTDMPDTIILQTSAKWKLECGPMPNVMVALPNIGGDHLVGHWPAF